MPRKRRRPLGTALVAVLVSFVAPTPVGSLRCYVCTVKPPRGANATQLCSRFDGGPSYEVECPLSTLCESRTFRLHTHRGENVENNLYAAINSEELLVGLGDRIDRSRVARTILRSLFLLCFYLRKQSFFTFLWAEIN